MGSTVGLHNYTSTNQTGVPSGGTENANEQAGRQCLLILDGRALDRECLASALEDHELGMAVVAMGSIDEWRVKKGSAPPLAAILFNLGGRKVTDHGIADEIRHISS
jgi:hypothetical protein